MSEPKKLENPYITLKKMSAETGIRITDACKAAGIDAQIVWYWKRNAPNSVEQFNKISAAMHDLAQKKDVRI